MVKYIVTTLFFHFLFQRADAIIYVNQNVPGGAETGTSWSNAFLDLQQALNVSQNGDTIWVAQGTYYPTDGIDRAISFEIVDGVKIFGGFVGFETDITQRNIHLYPTILSGDIGIKDVNVDNSFHVVKGTGLSSDTELDGFIISEGNAEGAGFSLSRGAGIILSGSPFLYNSLPIFSNCTIERNYAENGAGVYTESTAPQAPLAEGGLVNPIFRGCNFFDNKATVNGGGVYLNSNLGYQDTLMFENCIFSRNQVPYFFGGAIYINQAVGPSYMFRDCKFSRDSASIGGVGGAIFIEFAESDSIVEIYFHLDRCVFTENYAAEGAGVQAFYQPSSIVNRIRKINLMVKDCEFEKNRSYNGDGSVLNWQFTWVDTFLIKLYDSRFLGNSSSTHNISLGGNNGINIELDVDRCLFSNNYQIVNPSYTCFALSCGVGDTNKPNIAKNKITNSIFSNNGGGVFSGSGPKNFVETHITNCTFFNNNPYVLTKSYDTLGLNPMGFHNDMYVTNCLFWETQSDWQRLFYNNDPGFITMYGFHFDHSMFNIPKEQFVQPGGFDSFGPNSIFESSPEFVDTLLGDFHLMKCSPAVNAGQDSISEACGLTVDFDENPRFFSNAVDLGALESQDLCDEIEIHKFYVNLNVQGGMGNGTSWENAFVQVRDALAIAKFGDTIWVAQGTYYPTDGIDRALSFQLKDGVKMYGGFNGTESSLEDRKPQLQKTALSGDIGVTGVKTDNSYRVLYGKGLGAATVLDGFFVKDGNGTSGLGAGGGLAIEALPYGPPSRPNIINCTFENNLSILGGGIAIVQEVGPPPGFIPHLVLPKISNCTFIKNQATSSGGGIYWASPVPVGDTAFIENCLFSQNLANGKGSGVCLATIENASFSFLKCRFERSRTLLSPTGFGGGVYINPLQTENTNGTVSFDSCQFVSNKSPVGAAILYPFQEGLSVGGAVFRMVLNGCTLDSNLIVNGSGAIIDIGGNGRNSIEIRIDGSTFVANQGGTGIISLHLGSQDSSDVFVRNSTFINNENIDTEGEILSISVRNGEADAIEKTQIINSLFSGNSGGVSSTSGVQNNIRTEILNCTFYKNGDRLFRKNWDDSFVPNGPISNETSIVNSLIWEPQMAPDSLFTNIEAGGGNSMEGYNIEYCSVPEISTAYTQSGASNAFGLENQFAKYPMFIDTQNLDLRLIPCSPQVNSGFNLIADTLALHTDLAGEARIFDNKIDIGAYETQDTCSTIEASDLSFGYSKISISPNPVAVNSPFGITNLSPEIVVEGIKIYNSFGREIVANRVQSIPWTLLSPPQAGVYLVMLSSKEGIYAGKVVVCTTD